MTAALIAKLESASEGSRELDAEVVRLFGGQAVYRFGDWDCREDGTGIWRPLPRYSSSIDAALALAERCLPNPYVWVGRNRGIGGSSSWSCELVWGDDFKSPSIEADAASGALAICAALLRASAAEGAGG